MSGDTGWLDAIFDDTAAKAAVLLRREGVVESVVWGLDPRGTRCAIIQVGAEDAPGSVETGLGYPAVTLPAPLQSWQPTITNLFRRTGSNAALWVGESWLFPPGKEGREAASALLAGTGGLPSQHPNRREAVFVFATSPLRGYTRMGVWEIVRRPHRPPQLGDNLSDAAADGEDDFLSWSASWLEECLPAPDDRR